MRRGMAPEEAMAALFMVEAERVRMVAAECSCRVRSEDWKKQSMGSSAPASTILILFL